MADLIWVYAEVVDGKISRATLELFSKAAELGTAEAVLLGPGPDDAVTTLSQHGASKVYRSDDAIYRDHPTLAFDLTWLAAQEEQILDEHLLSIGRRTALERIAYLLLHLFVRAEQIGLAKGNVTQFPLTQQHIADTLGMSLVHTNKTLKRLTASKALRWKDKSFQVMDRDALAEIAQYDVPPRRRRPFI